MPEPFKLIIEDDEGKRNVVPVELGEVTVGRLDGNAIRLNERNVSRTHMRLVRESNGSVGPVFAEDLDSYNGVFINGTRITSRQPIHEGDLIRVGDFHLELRGEGLTRRTEETTQRTMVPDLDSTQPEIHVPTETTEVNVQAPDLTPAPMQPHSSREEPEEEEERAEPTAIIRMDQLEDLEDAKKRQQGLAAGDRPKILCVATQFAGAEFEVMKGEVVIGRTTDNDIAVDHRSVSRHHAKIITAGNTYKIVDLGSANGTLVNGEQYAQLALKSGDLVELGHVKFRFIPPGTTYTPTAEESAAIQNKGRSSTGVLSEEFSTQMESAGLLAAAKANPFGAMAAVTLMLSVVVFGSWILIGQGDDSPDAAPTETASEVGLDGTGAPENPAAKLVAKAQEWMAKRQWRKASKLLSIAVERDPNNEEALELLAQAETEIEAKKKFDGANRAVRASKWDEAWNNLSSIPEDSVYWPDAEEMRAQVGSAMATTRINDAREALEAGKPNKAQEIIEELRAIDPDNAELSGLEAELDDSFEAADSPPRAARRPVARRDPKPKAASKPTAKASTPKPAPEPKAKPAPEPKAKTPTTGGDAKSFYKKGISDLKGGNLKKGIDSFNKCIQADRAYCLCYRAMGIAYAKQGNGPKAARYYRLYLKYCPDATDADQVRALLKGP